MQRQKEVNDAKTRLYTNITHEFRTPLTVIPGMVNSDLNQRLLIIEDNQDLVGYLKACYKNLFSITVALDGREGLKQAVEEIPDIIISDVMMPEMDGFELCKN